VLELYALSRGLGTRGDLKLEVAPIWLEIWQFWFNICPMWYLLRGPRLFMVVLLVFCNRSFLCYVQLLLLGGRNVKVL
jgi:hypothetical protein